MPPSNFPDQYNPGDDPDEVNHNNDTDEEDFNMLDEAQNYPLQPRQDKRRYEESPHQINIPGKTQPNMHMGNVIFNNHNYVQNINMVPQKKQQR